MELYKDSISLGKSFSKFLDDSIPKEKPESLYDDIRLITIVSASINAAHTSKGNLSDVGFFVTVEKHLKIYDVEMTVEEYMYVSNLLERIITPVIEKQNESAFILEQDNSKNYTR